MEEKYREKVRQYFQAQTKILDPTPNRDTSRNKAQPSWKVSHEQNHTARDVGGVSWT
jgi:hypothetical protein